jgi:penicillin amidase
VDLSLRPVDPDTDLELLHGWVTAPGAEFWGMADKPRDEVGLIYAWIEDQPHLAAYLVMLGETPVGLFQTYDPAVDEIGDFYERRPGDLGVHLLLADTPARAGNTREILDFLAGWALSQPGSRRVVVEPDVRNERSLAAFRRIGFRLGPRVELPGKVAQFAFLER